MSLSKEAEKNKKIKAQEYLIEDPDLNSDIDFKEGYDSGYEFKAQEDKELITLVEEWVTMADAMVEAGVKPSAHFHKNFKLALAKIKGG